MSKRTSIFASIIISGMLLLLLSEGCEEEVPNLEQPSGTQVLTATPQDMTGDTDSGWHYLRYGNYVGGGIPLNVYATLFGTDPDNYLNRIGDNVGVSESFNAFILPNGVKAVGGLTCFGCHSAVIDEQFYPGLGNSFSDFTDDNTLAFQLVKARIDNDYGLNSPEWDAFANLHRGAVATASSMVTPFRGVNPAFILEEVAVSNRDPESMEWMIPQNFLPGSGSVASDVPAWWNVKKKNALYYNGMGRGDFTKLLMQVSVVGIEDTGEVAEIHTHFKDVLAWIMQLEPPAYPKSIDQNLADQGKVVFESTCARCHGTYGDEETYPNLLVGLDVVKTDSVYAKYFIDNPAFSNWVNASWFGKDGNAEALPGRGYVAPPLDGIWATAPYLHNASVPTLEDLLNSPQRPAYWTRTYQSTDFDWDKVGWNYTVETGPAGINTYNTTVPGYGNQGHTFGDGLDTDDRTALIEYLKTL